MLPEALVILACVTSKGCSETSSHYYATHPELKKIVKHSEQRIKDLTGPYVIETVGPLIYVAAGGTGTIRIGRDFSLQMNKEQSILSYRWEF